MFDEGERKFYRDILLASGFQRIRNKDRRPLPGPAAKIMQRIATNCRNENDKLAHRGTLLHGNQVEGP